MTPTALYDERDNSTIVYRGSGNVACIHAGDWRDRIDLAVAGIITTAGGVVVHAPVNEEELRRAHQRWIGRVWLMHAGDQRGNVEGTAYRLHDQSYAVVTHIDEKWREQFHETFDAAKQQMLQTVEGALTGPNGEPPDYMIDVNEKELGLP